VEIVTACQSRPDREKLIRLYITKAGHSIADRISVEGIQGEADLFYEMNYQAVSNNLRSANHQLHQSDDIPGIYFFHTTSNKVWDETPFEFDEAINKLFSDLPDLPVVRKKEKPGKFVFPTPDAKTKSAPAKDKKAEPKKAVKIAEKGPRQPDYRLKKKIQFTDLEKIVYRKTRLNKRDVLDYYDQVAEYILPYLKDRPQLIRGQWDDGRSIEFKNADALLQNKVELPDWIQTFKGKNQERLLLCNDKEHLLFFIEKGCLEFNPYHARTRAPEYPDYMVITVESPEAAIGKAIDVAIAAKEILSGLASPSFIKSDGTSRLHIYISLDTKSKADTTMAVAEYICKLIRIKVPDLVTLNGTDDYSFGKVSLDYQINEGGGSVVAPYSLVLGQSATIATPLLWEEVKEGLQLEDFNPETIFKRLKQIGDPFEGFLRKKVNAETLLDRMETNYSFLF
jgi:bifunctional non-homologous end joining protein LigD